MLLSRKHANQQSIARADFTGGLNTTITADGIAENQLSEVVNMEVDGATGRLKTVSGTTDILLDEDGDITAAFYDQINNIFLVVKGKTEKILFIWIMIKSGFNNFSQYSFICNAIV